MSRFRFVWLGAGVRDSRTVDAPSMPDAWQAFRGNMPRAERGWRCWECCPHCDTVHETHRECPTREPNLTGPTRSGVVVIFFLLWCAAIFGGTLLGLRTPRTVEQVEHRWHGPAHQYPQEYTR